jgi:hypothetical protein
MVRNSIHDSHWKRILVLGEGVKQKPSITHSIVEGDAKTTLSESRVEVSTYQSLRWPDRPK